MLKPHVGSNWIVGVVGALQFDVLADRIRTEFNIAVQFESVALHAARWVESDDHNELKSFVEKNRGRGGRRSRRRTGVPSPQRMALGDN